MEVMVCLSFKARGTDEERIHHLYIPAVLETSDGSLETQNMMLKMSELCGLTVDCLDTRWNKKNETND